MKVALSEKVHIWAMTRTSSFLVKKHYLQSCWDLFTAWTLGVVLIRREANTTPNDASLGCGAGTPLRCPLDAAEEQPWSLFSWQRGMIPGPTVFLQQERTLGSIGEVSALRVGQLPLCALGRCVPGGRPPCPPLVPLCWQTSALIQSSGCTVLIADRLRPRDDSCPTIPLGQWLVQGSSEKKVESTA